MAVIEITPTGNIIGATVRGISLQNIPVGQPIEALEDALEHYGVLIFPNQQNVTPAEQIAFSQVLGSLEVVDVPHALLPGYPEIFVVGNTGKKLVTFSPAEPDGELEWHTGDAVFWDNRRVRHAGTPYDITNSRRQMHRTTISETIQVQPANTEIQ